MTHKHAELIAKFAEVAKTTDQPHKQFQYLSRKHGGWRTFKKDNPKWNPDVAYRFKQETVVVNGVEVPRPLRYEELAQGLTYYVVVSTGQQGFCSFTAEGGGITKMWADRGLVHRTREEAKEHTAALGWN